MMGKIARQIIANLSAQEMREMNHDELIELAKAGQNEIRNDIRRFKKAGVSAGAFALQAFKRSTTEHDYTYSYYSIKERKEVTRTKHIEPEVSYMARINKNKSEAGLKAYILRMKSYFGDSKTNTVEGINKHQRYIRFYMGGGEIIEDEEGTPVDYVPAENFSDEDVAKFYEIYNAARKEYGSEFSKFYQSIRDAIVYNFRNGGDFKTMSKKDVVSFLIDNPDYVADPSGTIGRDDALK